MTPTPLDQPIRASDLVLALAPLLTRPLPMFGDMPGLGLLAMLDEPTNEETPDASTDAD
jgi:hypothetical protein